MSLILTINSIKLLSNTILYIRIYTNYLKIFIKTNSFPLRSIYFTFLPIKILGKLTSKEAFLYLPFNINDVLTKVKGHSGTSREIANVNDLEITFY